VQQWSQYELEESLCESLAINQFKNPTEVQSKSLLYLQQHIDMVIAAKTGQGKTLCFGIPILDLLIKKIQKAEAVMSDSEGEEEKEEPKKKKEIFTSAKALIMSPTRELAIQIRDMITAVIPMEYQD